MNISISQVLHLLIVIVILLVL